MTRKTIFFAPTDKSLAKKISIKSPSAFRKSITDLSRGGLTLKEKRGLVLARTRASAILRRKNLSPSERKEFREISITKIPKITRRN